MQDFTRGGAVHDVMRYELMAYMVGEIDFIHEAVSVKRSREKFNVDRLLAYLKNSGSAGHKSLLTWLL